MSKMVVGGRAGQYELLGVDWSEKRLGIPTWGWAAGLAYLAYRFMKKR